MVGSDDPDSAEIMKRRLPLLGYHVGGIVHIDGQSGTQCLKRAKDVDLVFIEISNKGCKEKLSLAEQIKVDCKLPVAILAAFGDYDYSRETSIKESFGYIAKPYCYKEIESGIQTAICQFKIEAKYRELQIQAEKKVDDYKSKIEELNTAIRVLSKYQEDLNSEIMQSCIKKVREMIIPHIETLRMKCPRKEFKQFFDIMQDNLEKISDPQYKPFSDRIDLTVMEARVAELVQQGRSSKEIAYLLGITQRGVTFHRTNIRKKLNIHSSKTSLKSALDKK